MSDIHATINFLKGCATADTSRLGIVGFCMGGRIAFLGAAATTLFKAAVDFYGGGCLLAMGRPPGAGDAWRRMFAARSKATSASSTRIRRRTKCAGSTPSSPAWARPMNFSSIPTRTMALIAAVGRHISPTMTRPPGPEQWNFSPNISPRTEQKQAVAG